MSIDDVTDLAPRVRYTASAAQDEFDYPFPIFQGADLVVDVDGDELTLTTEYTVDGEGDDTGGTVTLVTPLDGGEIVTIYRDTVIERVSDQQQNGPYASSTFNDEFDKAYTIMQELKAKIGRAIRFPFTAPSTDLQNELSPLSSWYEKFLYIGATGLLEAATIVDGLVVLTQSALGQILNPQTTAELAAGVTPTNYWYLPGNIKRYGAVSNGSATINTTAWQAAVAQAIAAGHDAANVYVPFSRAGYQVNAGATITNIPIRIVGDNPYYSNIYSANNVTLLTIENVQAGHGVIIEGVGFESTYVGSRTAPLVLVKNSSVGQILQCKIAAGGYGLKFEVGAQAPFSCFSWSIEDSTIGGNAICNIHCAANTNHLQLRNVTFGGSSPIGLYQIDCGGLNILGGDCEACTSVAIDIDATVDISIGACINGVDLESNICPLGVIRIGATAMVRNVTLLGGVFHNAGGSEWYINPLRCAGLTVIGCGTNSSTASGDAINPAGDNPGGIVQIGNFWQGVQPMEIIKGTLGFSDGAITTDAGFSGRHADARAILTYSTSMTPNAAYGNQVDVVITDGVAFAVNAPSNAVDGQELNFTFFNTSGGAHGTGTFNAVYKMQSAATTLPAIATGSNRSIRFKFRTNAWHEISRTAADVPN